MTDSDRWTPSSETGEITADDACGLEMVEVDKQAEDEGTDADDGEGENDDAIAPHPTSKPDIHLPDCRHRQKEAVWNSWQFEESVSLIKILCVSILRVYHNGARRDVPALNKTPLRSIQNGCRIVRRAARSGEEFLRAASRLIFRFQKDSECGVTIPAFLAAPITVCPCYFEAGGSSSRTVDLACW